MSFERHQLEIVLAGIKMRTGVSIHPQAVVPSKRENSLLLLEAGLCAKLFPPSRLKQFCTETLALQRFSDLPFVPKYIDSNIESNQYGWILQSRIQGKNICLSSPELNDDVSRKIICQVADWLRALHKMPLTNDDHVFQHSSPQRRIKWINDNFQLIPQADQAIAINAIHMVERQIKLESTTEWTGFVHRDFGFRNLLFHCDDGGVFHLSGVLDFEHCHIGNTVSDLAMFIMQDLLGFPDLQRLLIQRYLVDRDNIQSVSEFFQNKVRPELLINALISITWSHMVSDNYYRKVKFVLNEYQ